MKSGRRATPPPAHLTDRGKALWAELVRDRCDSVERQVLLRSALEDLDRADALRELIAAEGVVVTSVRSKLSRPHPALKIETEARRRFLSTWRALGLQWPA